MVKYSYTKNERFKYNLFDNLFAIIPPMLDKCIIASDKPLKKNIQNLRKSTKTLRVITCEQKPGETWQVYYRKLNLRRGKD